MENSLITEPVRYGGLFHGVLPTNSFGSAGEKKNSFVLLSGDGETWDSPWAAKVVTLLRICAYEIKES